MLCDSDKVFVAGEKEEEIILGTCDCSIGIRGPVHLFRLHHSCREERSADCKEF